MKKRILTLTLALSLVLQCCLITTHAAGLDPYAGFSATAADGHKGANISFNERRVGAIYPGEWVCYKGLDFGKVSPSAVKVSVGVPSGYAEAVELRIDSYDGPLIASVPITPSGSWSTPVTNKASLRFEVTGIHDLYVTHSNSTSDIFNIQFVSADEGSGIPEFDDTDAYIDIVNDVNRRAINILRRLDILRGYEENKYEPQLPVTRGEFAYSVFKLYGVDDAEASYEFEYSDVNPEKYYAQAISFLTGMGIINGTTADSFRPDDFIRHIDALAIICRVLGYETLAQEFGGYPTGYLRIASDEKFYVSNIGTSDYLRRTDMADMIYKAIDAESLMFSGMKNDYITYEKEEGLLYKTQGLYVGFGKVNTNYLTDLYSPETDVQRTEVVIENDVYNVGYTNADTMIGFDCEFYYSEDDNGERTLKAILPMAGVNYYELSSNCIESISDDKIVYYNEKDKKKTFDIKKDTAVLYNGVSIDDSLENTISDIDNFCGSVLFVENTDGKDMVMIDEYINYVVGEANITDEFILDANNGEKIELNSEKDYVFIKKHDALVTMSDITENDVLSVYASKNRKGAKYIRVYASTDEISGEITLVDTSSETVLIDGNEYKISPYCTFVPELNQSGIFKLDINGYIMDYEFANVSERLVGLYLTNALDSKGIDKSAKIKLITSSGEPEVLTFAKKATIDGLRISDAVSIINGKDSWGGISALDTTKPLRYSVNSDGEIIWMDTLLTGSGGIDDMIIQLSDDSKTHNYQSNILSINSIGKYYVPTTATIFSYFDDFDSDEKNWSVGTFGKLLKKEMYPVGELYSSFGNNYSGDLFVWRNARASAEYVGPIVYTGMTTVINDDGEIVYNIQGINGRTPVNYILSMDAYEAGILKDALPGDTIRIKTNADKEIFEAQYIVFRDGTASRGGSSAMVSVNKRYTSKDSNGSGYLYGKVDEKGDEYLAVDIGTTVINGVEQPLIELITRKTANVIVVSTDSRDGEYVVDYGLDARYISGDDVVFVRLTAGKAGLIVVYKEAVL